MGSRAFGSKSASKPHLIQPGGGLSGEIHDLRQDVEEAFSTLETSLSPYIFQAGAIPCEATDADGIATQFASVILGQTLSDDDLDGALVVDRSPKVAVINPPKKVTLTVGAGGTATDWDDGDIVFTGTDVDGGVLTETVTSTGGAAQTVTSTQYFATIDTVELPTATGTGAQLTLGVVLDTAPIALITTSTSAQDINTNGEFNRARVGNRDMGLARTLSLVFSSHANWDASTGGLVIYGKDAQGLDISEAKDISNNGNETITTTLMFRQVTRITLVAQSGTNGTLSVGFTSTTVGLPRKILDGAIADVGLRELSRTDENDTSWAAPTAGTVTIAASATPYGLWTPNVAPNGVMEYTFIYFAEGV